MSAYCAPWKIETVRHKRKQAHVHLIFWRRAVRRKLFLESATLQKQFGKRVIELPSVNGEYRSYDVLDETEQIMNQMIDKRQRLAIRQDADRTPTQIEYLPRGSDNVIMIPNEEKGRQRQPCHFKGIIHIVGRQLRTDQNRQYKQYAVDIALDELDGKITRFWGVDLEQAVEAAAVVDGDHVTLTDHGAIEAWSPKHRKTVYRKEYSITKEQ